MTLPRVDKPWLDHVRGSRCCLCASKTDVVPHHCRHIRGFGGIGLKPHDCLVVPACSICHERIHHGFRGNEEAVVNDALIYLLMEYMERKFTEGGEGF